MRIEKKTLFADNMLKQGEKQRQSTNYQNLAVYLARRLNIRSIRKSSQYFHERKIFKKHNRTD